MNEIDVLDSKFSEKKKWKKFMKTNFSFFVKTLSTQNSVKWVIKRPFLSCVPNSGEWDEIVQLYSTLWVEIPDFVK